MKMLPSDFDLQGDSLTEEVHISISRWDIIYPTGKVVMSLHRDEAAELAKSLAIFSGHEDLINSNYCIKGLMGDGAFSEHCECTFGDQGSGECCYCYNDMPVCSASVAT